MYRCHGRRRSSSVRRDLGGGRSGRFVGLVSDIVVSVFLGVLVPLLLFSPRGGMGSCNIWTIGSAGSLCSLLLLTPPERFGFGGGFEQIHTLLATCLIPPTYYRGGVWCFLFNVIIWGDIHTRMDASFFRCTTGSLVVMVDIHQPPNPYTLISYSRNIQRFSEKMM